MRHQSGVPTLEEIKESLVFDSSVPDSVAVLLNTKTHKEKLELLFSWEKQSNRQAIRYAFHQGYHIDTICKLECISTRTLHERTQFSLSELQRKRQLYNDLGDFRSLVYSTLPLYRILNNTKKIKQQLEKLSPSELHFWNNPVPPTDASGLLNCFINANQGQVSNKIYYQCDLFNNNIEEIPIDKALESLCIKLLTLSSAKTADAFNNFLTVISQQKCIIGYTFTRSKYRALLKVSSNATLEEIETAYRKLARKAHPDKNSGENATATFQELHQAYDALLNGRDEFTECSRFSLLVKDEHGSFNSSDPFYHELLGNLSTMKEAVVFSIKE